MSRTWSHVAKATVMLFVCSAASGQAAPLTLRASPAAPIGSPLFFQIDSGSPLTPYVFDLSLTGTSPGISLSPTGPVVPLNPPIVYLQTFGGSPALAGIFQNFSGVTDAQGRAKAVLDIPVLPQVIGVPIDGCFVTLSPGSPGGVGVI